MTWTLVPLKQLQRSAQHLGVESQPLWHVQHASNLDCPQVCFAAKNVSKHIGQSISCYINRLRKRVKKRTPPRCQLNSKVSASQVLKAFDLSVLSQRVMRFVKEEIQNYFSAQSKFFMLSRSSKPLWKEQFNHISLTHRIFETLSKISQKDGTGRHCPSRLC